MHEIHRAGILNGKRLEMLQSICKLCEIIYIVASEYEGVCAEVHFFWGVSLSIAWSVLLY